MEYYIKINEEKRGPYSLNELAERKLDATTLVMPTDGVKWVPANQIEELRTLFESKDPINKAEKTEEMPFLLRQDLSYNQHNKKQFSSHKQHLRRRVTLVVLSVFCLHWLSWLQ